MRVILARHAHHDSGGRFTQHSCEGLTPAGREQAADLAERLARLDLGADVVVMSSQARRCFETAEIVAAQLALPFAGTTCDLCEMHPGQAEGLTMEEMQERFGPHYGFVPGAEHYPDWLPGAVERLQRLVAGHDGRALIGITHFAVIKAAHVAFGGWSPADVVPVRAGNAEVFEWLN